MAPDEFYNFTLWINGGPADAYVDPIPPYNPRHIYVFIIDASAARWTFAVGDAGIPTTAASTRLPCASASHADGQVAATAQSRLSGVGLESRLQPDWLSAHAGTASG